MDARSNYWKPPPLQVPLEAKCVTLPGQPGDDVPLALRSRFKGGGIGEKTMSVRYAVIFEQAECNWAAYVPDLPGCITTGRTFEETIFGKLSKDI